MDKATHGRYCDQWSLIRSSIIMFLILMTFSSIKPATLQCFGRKRIQFGFSLPWSSAAANVHHNHCFLNSPLLRVEECVDDVKPVRRGFLRKGGGRHDPEDSEVTAMIMVVVV